MKGTDDVGLNEFAGTVNGAIDMTLSREIDHRTRTVLGQQSIDERRITDIASHEQMPRIPLEAGKIVQIARIGELVEIDQALLVLRQPVKNEVGTDKPGAAGDQNGHGMMGILV
ncbi:MAG: hypothetical protein P0120_11680 [Nitrospira sp.]|nr:hypothetical protein [Nitrospira sp.]